MRPYRQLLDEDSAARLLQGVVHPDDAPPGYGSVAHLLASAARLPQAPLDEEEASITVASMVEAIGGAGPAPAPEASRRRPMLGRLLAGKALAAVAVLGFTATGAAAAAGSLPDPVQGVVSDAVSHVGVNIPHPNHGRSADHRKDGEHRKDGQNGQPEHGGQPAGENSGDPDKGMSQFVEEHKGGEGRLGQVVCVEASDGKCHSGAENPGKGDRPGEANTPPGSGPAQNPGQGRHPGGGRDQVTPPAGDSEGDSTPPTGDAGTGEATSPTPPKNDGLDTAAGTSGKAVPAGKGKPAGDD